MESARQILKNNPHFVNFMSQMKGKEIIKTLQSNPQALEEVLMWIVGNGHDKTFKKCRANIAEDCAVVGPADDFEGRRCRACANKYRLIQKRERKRRERKMTGKKKRRTYKNLTSSDDDSSDDETIHERIKKNVVSELARASKNTKTTTLQMCTVTSLDGRHDETYADYEAYNESSGEYSDVSSTSSESECEKTKRWNRKSTRKGRK